MIVQIRVDDRLIHGQVALMWGKELNTKGIHVANDHAAGDETQAATLKMACPADQKLLIRTVDEAIKVVADPRGKDMRIFGLVDKVSDALKIVEGAPGAVGAVNVANTGRFDRSDDAAKVTLVTNVTLNPDEVEATKKLVATGVPVIHQVGVTDTKTNVADLVAKLG